MDGVEELNVAAIMGSSDAVLSGENSVQSVQDVKSCVPRRHQEIINMISHNGYQPA